MTLLLVAAIGVTLVLLFPVEWARTPTVSVAAEQTAISPNGDGERDTVPVIYSLSTDATVTIEVLDESHALVRRLAEEELQAAGQHTLVWDGLDRLGQALPDGTYFIRVSAQAAVRKASANVQVNVDTTPPVIRLANVPEEDQVGGDQTELLIEGVTDPDATVWFNDWARPLEVSEDGRFQVTYILQEGTNRIELTAVDEAGNRTSVVREIVMKTEPPDIVLLNPPDGLWINERMLSVQGTVPPGTQVTINQTKATVDESGHFNEDIVLEEGENIVHVEAVDAVGNTSIEERRVYLNTQPPPLSLTTVEDGMTVREPSLLVVGKTSPQSNVWLNGRELAVDNQGGFQGVVNLIEGENVVRVEAVDRAGNSAVVVREVTYSAQPAAQEFPPAVRNVLVATGLGMAGVAALWLVGGLWQRPLSLVLRVTRSTLTPAGLSGRLEPAVVVFELSRPATVTAKVWDLSGRHVATVFQKQRRAQGEHLLVWDGRDANGQVASPGVYEVEVSASTLFNTVSGSARLEIEERVIPQPTWGQQGYHSTSLHPGVDG